MGGYAKPSVNNIIDIEEEPMKGVQVTSNDLKKRVVVMFTLYGFQNLPLSDRPPFKGQLPLPTKEM
jgi:hypothetical protein